MSERGLTSDDIKRRYAAVISRSGTFRPQGVSEQEALDYLKTDEGAIYYWRVAEAAEPNLRPDQIQDRVIGQIRSGRKLPRMETIGTDEVLVKFVAKGFEPSEFSPYWARESAGNAAVEAGKNISRFHGLPIGSEAPRYGMYRMTARKPTQIFITTVAPTSELDGLLTKVGGGRAGACAQPQVVQQPGTCPVCRQHARHRGGSRTRSGAERRSWLRCRERRRRGLRRRHHRGRRWCDWPHGFTLVRNRHRPSASGSTYDSRDRILQRRGHHCLDVRAAIAV